MNFSIAELAKRSGLRSRRLRYVVDHDLAVGLSTTRSGQGNTRRLDQFQAFVVLVAAHLLEVGYSRTAVRYHIQKLGGTTPSTRAGSLHKLWKERLNSVVLCDGSPRRCKGIVRTVVDLGQIRDLVSH